MKQVDILIHDRMLRMLRQMQAGIQELQGMLDAMDLSDLAALQVTAGQSSAIAMDCTPSGTQEVDHGTPEQIGEVEKSGIQAIDAGIMGIDAGVVMHIHTGKGLDVGA